MIAVDLDTYIAARIALAMAMLQEPHNPKHRAAYNALHDALVAENARELHESTMPTPMLLRKQAG